MGKTKQFLLGTLIFFSLNNICKTLTDNFSLRHLTKPGPINSIWATEEKPDFLPALLQQKYTYLGKGMQAFVFVSEDGEHVLKVFKPLFPKYTFHFLGKPYNIRISKIPFAQAVFALFHKEEIIKQKEKDFQSYTNSFAFLKEETGLEYLHLAKTKDLKTTLQISDKIGAIHTLDLDETCFLLQKRTDLLYPTLFSYIQQNDLSKAKNLLDSFVQLAFTLWEKRVINPTTVEKNFGYLDAKVLLIDTGRVFKEENPLSLKQIDNTVHHMKKWLKTKNPLLSQYLEELLEKEKNKRQSQESL